MAWGAGADWAIAQVPELLGADDDWSGLDSSSHPLLDRTRRAVPGLRIPRTALVFESLVPAVLEQRVVGADARQSWRQLVTKFGCSRARAGTGRNADLPTCRWSGAGSLPGNGISPASTRVGPPPSAAAVRVAAGLQRTIAAGRGGPAVTSALRTVPGIGVWTAAETVQRAHGDPDTVSVGDYHLAALVGWALIGRPSMTTECSNYWSRGAGTGIGWSG